MSTFIELTSYAYPGEDGDVVTVNIDHIATMRPDSGHPNAGQKPLGTIISLAVTALAEVHVTESYSEIMEAIADTHSVLELIDKKRAPHPGG